MINLKKFFSFAWKFSFFTLASRFTERGKAKFYHLHNKILNLNQNKIHFESICKEKCFIILLITEMEMR